MLGLIEDWNIHSYILLGRQHVVLVRQALGSVYEMHIVILWKKSVNTS